MAESEPNDAPSPQSLGTFDAGDLVRVSGTMDAAGGNDSYQVTLSNTSSPRKIEVTVVWSGGDVIDAAIGDGVSDLQTSSSAVSGREPGASDSQFRATGLTPGSSYIVRVDFKSGVSPGTAYELFINATP
jgi:hypothetical protein